MQKSLGSKPQLVVVNSDKDIEDRKYDKQGIPMECLVKKCGYKWFTTIGAFRDDPQCPRCKNPLE